MAPLARTEELAELELGSCFELVSSAHGRQCKVAALRHGFVHLSESEAAPLGHRRSRSAEPRTQAEAEAMAFERYVATFHFAWRKEALNPRDGVLKSPTGARQKLAELALPQGFSAFSIHPESEKHQCEPLSPVSTADSFNIDNEAFPVEVALVPEVPAVSPPGSPSRLRADAPAFVPGVAAKGPLLTLPQGRTHGTVESTGQAPVVTAFGLGPSAYSYINQREAGARAAPPPPPSAPPRLMAPSGPLGQIPRPPAAAPKLTQALLESARRTQHHRLSFNGAMLETASHGSCSSSTTVPSSAEEALRRTSTYSQDARFSRERAHNVIAKSQKAGGSGSISRNTKWRPKGSRSSKQA